MSTATARPVFLPKEFKLLRRPCKRYPPAATPKTRRESHAPGQVLTEYQTSYAGPGGGAAIGDGCYRVLPRRGGGGN